MQKCQWVPVVVAAREDGGLKGAHLLRGKDLGMRIPLAWMRTLASRSVFGVESCIQRSRFAWMPFAPAGRINFFAHLRIEIDHGCIRPPWTAEKHVAFYIVVGSQFAPVDHEARIFIWIVLASGRDEAALMRRAVNLAMVENRFVVTEYKIDVSGDVAIGKILPRCNAILSVWSTVAAAGIDRVLVAEEANVMEDGPIASDQQCQRLGSGGELRMRPIEVALEGDVFREEIIGRYIHGSRVQCATVRTSAAIVDHHGFGRVRICAAKLNVRLVDCQHFAVGSRSDQEQRSARGRRRVDGSLDRVVVSYAISRDVERLIFGRNSPGQFGGCFNGWERDKARLADQWRTWRGSGRLQDRNVVSGSLQIPRTSTNRDLRILGLASGSVADLRQRRC